MSSTAESSEDARTWNRRQSVRSERPSRATDLTAISSDSVHHERDGRDQKALRVIGVDPELRFAGGETQVLGLTRELKRCGNRAELLCDPAGELWKRASNVGIACHPLRIRNSVDFPAGMRLRAFLAHESFDVVHFHTARAHAMAPFARGLAEVLVVTRRMDYRPGWLSARWLYNRGVDGVAAISGPVADALVEAGVSRDKIVTIPSGVDCDRFRPPTPGERLQSRETLGLAPDDIAIGTVGMLEHRKGHEFLVQSMALCGAGERKLQDKADGRLVCLIAGSGSIRSNLQERIDGLGLSDRVRMMGYLEDPLNLLWALDIFAMPSLHEGLGVAALEAMACGLPVIASDTGGLRESVENGKTGMLVPPGDPQALLGAIDELARSSQMRAAMGVAGREAVTRQYGMAAMARRTMEFYRACLNKRLGGGGKG